ncbi:MAG: ornithine cyclodeaminase [Rhizobacter sp.]|nr:ornithine cyclodeaminase [Rhizobacter sp.]
MPGLVSIGDALAAVERTFAAGDCGLARSYPVVREGLGQHGAVFGVKSGFDMSAGVLGLKAGGYWPENASMGLGNHQSTILLFDPRTGRPSALIGANYLTGVRTGAASALAIRHLARQDASTLSLIGAGAQAMHQVRAALAVRPLKRVIAWSPAAAQLESLGQQVRALGLEFDAAATAEQAVRAADILVTVTPSTSAIVMTEWVRPGTHISAMGADTVGKQELASGLVAAARVVVDSVEQAVTIGECQHAFKEGLLRREDLTETLGGLASGRLSGRQAHDEITVFDSTGIALQDLAPAAQAVARARELGLGVEVAV